YHYISTILSSYTLFPYTTLFRSVLSASNDPGAVVTLKITNSKGAVVGQVSAASGKAVSLTLTLTPDTYTFTFTATRPDGNPVSYQLKGLLLSDPIGPQPQDPTTSSSPPPSDGTSSGTTYGGTTSSGTTTSKSSPT